MANPLTGSWAGLVVSAANLDKTTHGSGTTAERLALASWPTTRLFFDVTDGIIYKNSGTQNNIIWSTVGDPTGTLKIYAGTTQNIPTGYLLCDGQEVSRNTYSELFAIIGTQYGAPTNNQNFKLPNLINRFPKGAGDGDNPGNTGGLDEVTLTVDQMPAHNHTYIRTATQGFGGGSFNSGGNNTSTTETSSSGGDQPHENRPPFLEVLYLIKY